MNQPTSETFAEFITEHHTNPLVLEHEYSAPQTQIPQLDLILSQSNLIFLFSFHKLCLF
jgi:hypothetical protein